MSYSTLIILLLFSEYFLIYQNVSRNAESELAHMADLYVKWNDESMLMFWQGWMWGNGGFWISKLTFNLSKSFQSCSGCTAWWFHADWQQSSTVLPSQQNRGENSEKNLMVWNKNREIAHQLPSLKNQNQHRETNVIYCL